MELQKRNNLPPTLQQLSQSELCKTLTAGNFKAVSDSMPRTIKLALNEPPICEVEKVSGRNMVVRYVEFELIRMTSLVSVGGNMNDSQIQFAATQLVEMFSHESLADFKLCFERGCIGQYGEIYRMDGIVLRSWMEKYLDEKYQHVEATWEKEKKEEKGEVQPTEQGEGFKLAQEYAKKLADGNKVPRMDVNEIKRNGQEDAPRKTSVTAGMKYFNVRGVQIYASTQEHAEELALQLLKHGFLEEDKQQTA